MDQRQFHKSIKKGSQLWAGEEASLIFQGQGAIGFHLKEGFSAPSVLTLQDDQKKIVLRLQVGINSVTYVYEEEGEERFRQTREGIGLDRDGRCFYWFSLDSYNRSLRYGKGEVRRSNTLLEFTYPDKQYPRLRNLKLFSFSQESMVKWVVYRDPVVTEPPLLVFPQNLITMEDVAGGERGSPSVLSEEGRILYDTVAGPSFELNSGDFPNFSEAIEQSIRNPNGWCYKKLEEKARESGGSFTYLRITLGLRGGESPGVPYVMEIWPPGHSSPIHNHGNSNAVIKVLHGQIKVNFFLMLSQYHREPMYSKRIFKGDVTYITPELNQVHQLQNTSDTTCVTIQCYLYDNKDTCHYEFFDYLGDDNQEHQFTPDSDMDFILFKNTMKAEWENRPQQQ